MLSIITLPLQLLMTFVGVVIPVFLMLFKLLALGVKLVVKLLTLPFALLGGRKGGPRPGAGTPPSA
ncbi:MAG: hypothetical protein EXR48_07425 [Dehalococcoidia bacterium]|nr:hypothetical protein [Dehalococcoidia bacterium]